MKTVPSRYTEEQVSRFLVKVAGGSGCWRWKASKFPNGYGQIRVAGKTTMAHRMAYEVWVGPIPEGYDVDHVAKSGCRYKDCVRPSHLEPVTHAENLRRGKGWGGRNYQKTHCKNGHPFDSANTYAVKTGGRRCRTCFRDTARERYRQRVGWYERHPS